MIAVGNSSGKRISIVSTILVDGDCASVGGDSIHARAMMSNPVGSAKEPRIPESVPRGCVFTPSFEGCNGTVWMDSDLRKANLSAFLHSAPRQDGFEESPASQGIPERLISRNVGYSQY